MEERVSKRADEIAEIWDATLPLKRIEKSIQGLEWTEVFYESCEK